MDVPHILSIFQINQVKLRAESYKALVDHLQNRADAINSNVGKMVVLPLTFIVSPRNMMQLYQDSMAICRKIRKTRPTYNNDM